MLKMTKQREQARAPKPHIRKNDNVVVLSGKDRGKQGKVLRVIPSKGTAIVERVNFSKKHTRANPQKNQKGGIVERESPVPVSKLQLVCPSCNEPTRVGSKTSDEGRARVCKKCETEIG
jgi:large subunit ribosomal protein L24